MTQHARSAASTAATAVVAVADLSSVTLAIAAGYTRRKRFAPMVIGTTGTGFFAITESAARSVAKLRGIALKAVGSMKAGLAVNALAMNASDGNERRGTK